nr:hypothetical protein [Salmonella enterica]
MKAAYDLANGKAAGSHKHAWGDITDVPDGTTAQKGNRKAQQCNEQHQYDGGSDAERGKGGV